MNDVPAKPSFRTAVVYSFGQKYIGFVVHLALTVILARLLTPQETGIFSLAAAAVGIGHLLREFGMSDYVISQRDVSHAQLRAAFTVTMLLAWTIAAVLLAVAGPLASFYNEPGVAHVLYVLCLNFFLLPFGTITFALLSKELRFGLIFTIQTVSTLLSAVVTLGGAWSGWSYMSLALGSVTANLCTIVMLLVLQPQMVFLRPTRHGLREVVRFGGAMTVTRVIEQSANRSSDFIVSAMLGFHAGGLLSKANSLIGSFHEFFNSAVVRVATPAFARAEHQSEDARARYLQATVVVATAQWIFFPMLGIYAHEIVLVMFGPRWLECVPVVQVATVGAMFYAPFMLSTSLLTARGFVAEQMRIQLVSAPLLVAAMVVGSLYSLVMIAVLCNSVMMGRLVLLSRVLNACCGTASGAVMLSLLPSMGVGLAGVVAGFLGRSLASDLGLPVFVMLAVGMTAMFAASAVMAWRVNHPLFFEAAGFLRRRAVAWR